MGAFKIGLWAIGLGMAFSCQKSTYPCPDIHSGTQVVKPGSEEGLKKTEPEMDSNGRLLKKPYVHPGMKKKKR
jgi:hypothetical protein